MSTRDRVKELLAQGMKGKDIASALHISEARVSQLKKALLKIKPLTPLNLIPQPLSSQLTINSKQAQPYTARLHKHTFLFKLLSPISKDTSEVMMSSRLKIAPIRGMRGHIDTKIMDYTPPARLYPNGLLVYITDVEMPAEASISDLLAISYEKASMIASDFEMRSGLNLKRLTKDAFIATIRQQHIALVHTLILEWFREHHESLTIPDPDGGEPLLVIDFSHGTGELETLNVEKGEFVMGRAKALLDATAKGEFDYRDVAGLKEVANIILENQASQLKWFEHHDALTVNLNTLVAQLIKERRPAGRQRRLPRKPMPVQSGQRRLY